MAADYDFDIHWIFPRGLETDPAIGKLFSDIGFTMRSRGNYVALFRDPAVIAMIERANPVLREYLKASGFGFVPSGSGLPAGYYPGEDESALDDVLTRLDENLAKFPLTGINLGGFDFAAFLRAITAARPLLQTGAHPAPAAPRVHAPALARVAAAADAARPTRWRRRRARLVNLVGLALVALAALKVLSGADPF